MVLLWYWSHILSIGYHFGRTPTWELLCIFSVFWPFWGCSSPHASICQIDPSPLGRKATATSSQGISWRPGAGYVQITGNDMLCFFRCSAPGGGFGHVDLCCWTTSDEKRGHVHWPIDPTWPNFIWNAQRMLQICRSVTWWLCLLCSSWFILFIMLAPRSVGKTWVGRKARLVPLTFALSPWAWALSSCQGWNANWASAACLRTCIAQAGICDEKTELAVWQSTFGKTDFTEL